MINCTSAFIVDLSCLIQLTAMKFILVNLLATLKNLNKNSRDDSDCIMSLVSKNNEHFPVNPLHPSQSFRTFFEKEGVFQDSYWQGPGNFILDLGCYQVIHTIELVNANNNYWKNKSTKEFKIHSSDDLKGPWDEILHETLEDSREMDVVPLKEFKIKKKVARFIKFNMLSFYGDGGGLQYVSKKPG